MLAVCVRAQDLFWGNMHSQASVFTIRIVRRKDFNAGGKEVFYTMPTTTVPVAKFPAYLTSLMDAGVVVEAGDRVFDMDNFAINGVRADVV